jgi:hypothetical protein
MFLARQTATAAGISAHHHPSSKAIESSFVPHARHGTRPARSLKRKPPGAATAATATTRSSIKSSYGEDIPRIDDTETAAQLYGFHLESNAGLLAQPRIADMGFLRLWIST